MQTERNHRSAEQICIYYIKTNLTIICCGMKKVFVLLAEGSEPVEALSPIDILRRCEIETVAVSTGNTLDIKCSRGLKMEADILLSDIREDEIPDMLVLPGGMPGYKNLAESEKVGDLVKRCYAEDKYIAAICGAPSILAKYSVAEGCRVTCHSSVREAMAKYTYTGAGVEVDGNTGRQIRK